MVTRAFAVAVLTALIVHSAAAAPSDYRFVKIADSSQFGTGDPYDSYFYDAQLSAAGEVAFAVDIPAIKSYLYKGKGGALTKIAEETGIRSFIAEYDINAAGIVAYRMVTEDKITLIDGTIEQRSDYFASNGQWTNKIYADAPQLHSNNASYSNGLSINDRNQGVAQLTRSNGRETIVDQSGKTIATAPNNQTYLLSPAINNSGQVAYISYVDLGVGAFRTALRVGTQPSDLRTLVNPDTSNFARVGSPRINDSAEVVFEAMLDSGLNGIFIAADAVVRTVFIDDAAEFGELKYPGINNLGQVAFWGFDPIFETGAIYTGPDLVADRVIGSGDRLLGKLVQSVSFAGEINNAGQVAFTAVLADGSQAIFRADPRAPAPTVIPEPTSLAMLLAPFLALSSRYARSSSF